jgi:hypothetical protein
MEVFRQTDVSGQLKRRHTINETDDNHNHNSLLGDYIVWTKIYD